MEWRYIVCLLFSHHTTDTRWLTPEKGGKRMIGAVLFGIQLVVTIVVGVYFYSQLRQQRKTQPAHRKESGKE